MEPAAFATVGAALQADIARFERDLGVVRAARARAFGGTAMLDLLCGELLHHIDESRSNLVAVRYLERASRECECGPPQYRDAVLGRCGAGCV